MPPGGSYDYLARCVGEPLQNRLGQPVIIDNRSGADGRIGVDFVGRQPADGYTIGIISITNTVHPSLFKEMTYDIVKDFEPIGLIAHAPFVLVVGPSMQVGSAKDFIDQVRARPGEVTFASSGVGSPFHLGGELLKSTFNVNMLHVPYRGTGPITPALLGGEVKAALVPIGPFISHIKSGKLRALGTLTDERISVLPDVPTLNESLGVDNLSLIGWLGLVAPAGTPRPVVQKLSDQLQQIVGDARFFEEKLRPQAYERMSSTPDSMEKMIRKDVDRYAQLVREAKIPAV